MYKDISILICRVLGLYLFVALLSVLPSVVPMFFAPMSGVEAIMMQPVKIAAAIALIGQFVMAMLLWVKADFWASLVVKPIKGDHPEKSQNVSEICAAVLMAAGFLILALAIKDMRVWLPELLHSLNDSSSMGERRGPIHNWGVIAAGLQMVLGLLLIFTPRGIWNGISKIRKA